MLRLILGNSYIIVFIYLVFYFNLWLHLSRLQNRLQDLLWSFRLPLLVILFFELLWFLLKQWCLQYQSLVAGDISDHTLFFFHISIQPNISGHFNICWYKKWWIIVKHFTKHTLCYTNPITNTNTNINTLLVASYDELLFNILQNMFFVMRMQ